MARQPLVMFKLGAVLFRSGYSVDMVRGLTTWKNDMDVIVLMNKIVVYEHVPWRTFCKILWL